MSRFSHLWRRAQWRRSVALFAVLSCYEPAWAQAAAVDPGVERARALVREGNRHYAEGRLEAAYDAFLGALRAKFHYSIFANLAHVEFELGKYADAAEHLDAYLRMVPPTDAGERARAERKLESARSHVLTLEVAVSVDGAEVLLNGKDVGRSPLKWRLFASPGESVLEARAPGYVPEAQRVTGGSGETRGVTLTLAPRSGSDAPLGARPVNAGAVERGAEAQRPPDASGTPASQSRGVSARDVALYSGAALTVAAVGASAYFGIRSSAVGDDERALRRRITESSSDCTLTTSAGLCAELRGKSEDRADAASALRWSVVAAAGIGLTTTIVYFAWPASSTRASASIWATPLAGGITLRHDL